MTDPLWNLQLFGGLRARQGERTITRFRTQSTGSLLAFLAFYKGRGHSRESLIQLLWPDATPEAGRHNLSNALSSLRNQLEPPGVVAGTVILADRLIVELNPTAFTTDVEAFEQALRQANQPRITPGQKIESITRAMEAYTGPLLPTSYEEWITREQERLAERFREATLQLIRLHERQGDVGAALACAQRAISRLAFPDEEVSRELVRLLLQRGDAATALRQYKELERRLREELSAEPTTGTRILLPQIEEALKRSKSFVPDQTEEKIPSVRAVPAVPFSPPGGTVTFLLIENGSTESGSPRRLELNRHRAHVVREREDSLLLVFARASDAVDYALTMAAALPEEDREEEAAHSHARMALLTAEAMPDEQGEYPGHLIRSVSQMLTAAHAGQILCSATTGELIRADVTLQERGITVVDLGLYRLRQPDLPERLLMVPYPGMSQQEFPPPIAARADSGRLPLHLTRFFGRGEEIKQLVGMVLDPTTRLITLTGPGGTGKTRLALETGRSLLDPLAQSVWFVPLAEITDPAWIIGAIIHGLGLPRLENVDPFEQVVTALSARPSLLILDNFEQLLGSVGVEETTETGAALVQQLLERVPSLTVLVTSRQVLHLAFEQEFALGPLPTPGTNGNGSVAEVSLYESVQIFVDRAQSARPDFQITSRNAPAIAELCDRLEGIPLAIELAAARIGVMSPSQMLSLLGNRFEFLVSRKRGIVERQRTLRATLDWSYRLLDPSLQRFFAGLSVFRGGWTVEAAEQVLEEPLALDYLAQLRDCSLVQVGEMELVQPLGPTTTIVRFHLLETLREYAWEQLTEEEQHGLQERHIAFLVASIAKRSLISRWEAIGWFEAELSNCRAALVWGLSEQGNLDMAMHLCAGHGSVFWSHLGYWTEGRRWFIALLNRFSEPTATRAALLQAAGSLTDQQGDNTAALAMYQESLELGRALGNTEHTLNLLETNGFLACHMGRNEEGRAYFEEALQLSRSQGEDKDRVVGILNALGQLARNTGDFATAQAYCEQSLKLAEEMGDQTKVCYVFCELGLLAADKKDHITALTWYDKCIALCRKEVQQDILTLAHILTHRIDPLLASGDYAAAQQSGEEALAIFRHARDKWHTSYCLAHLATAASARGDFPAACTYLEECLEIRRELGNPGWILGTLLSLGRVALTAGDIPHARSVLAECLTMARDSGEDKTQWRYRTILHWLGLYDIVRGDYSSARAWYAECLPLARASTDSWALIPILEGLGILAEVENRQETAVQLWGTATTMRERLNSQPEALEEQILARYITRVRNTLGSDVFDSLFEQGRMLDQAAAIALGRGEYD